MNTATTSEDKYPPLGIYEHYKSEPKDRHYYQLLHIARHTETDEALVIYVPLYTASEHPGLVVQARPLAMFVEDVEHDGKSIPRFRYVGPEF